MCLKANLYLLFVLNITDNYHYLQTRECDCSWTKARLKQAFFIPEELNLQSSLKVMLYLKVPPDIEDI